MSARFQHHALRLLNPGFDSPLVDVIQDLEHLRKLTVQGTTPEPIFHQLKGIFHMLESIGSARIEGNHTTLADYVESSIEGTADTDQLNEIANIEAAMDFVDNAISVDQPLTMALVRECHAVTVKGLQREGDKTPGAFRTGGVSIAGASHRPPNAQAVPAYMDELICFINKEDAAKYDLMKVALAHHRFGWIHPFSNGNGRVVRLLTYALLIKYGFNVGAVGRVLNPTAVFCNDREKYYAMLALADRGDEISLEKWCVYVLSGIRDELEKLDQLTRYDYLESHVLRPALAYARERKLVSEEEFVILRATMTAEGAVMRSRDIRNVLPDLSDAQRTYRISKMLQRNLLMPVAQGTRQYTLCFRNSELLRGVVRALVEQGFVPQQVREPSPGNG
jgi:Fic family protein